jgi:hypothetical protein
MTKPSLFVGSSSEGVAFARAVRLSLEKDVEITLWNEGFFGLGNTFIETLVNSLPRFDFAILVLTEDDLTTSREIQTLSPRDNVIFELGLFMGRLGRSRTFILHQADAKVKIPSDLSGVTTATYTWPRVDQSHQRAVGGACDTIREVIRDLGVSETKTFKELGAIRSRQDRQESQLSTQEGEIRALKVALQGIVTHYEMDKLVGLSSETPFFCYYSDDLYNELKRLRAMNLVRNYEGVGLSTIRRDYMNKNQQFDLRRFFFVTEQGREYIELRRQLTKETSDSE